MPGEEVQRWRLDSRVPPVMRGPLPEPVVTAKRPLADQDVDQPGYVFLCVVVRQSITSTDMCVKGRPSGTPNASRVGQRFGLVR